MVARNPAADASRQEGLPAPVLTLATVERRLTDTFHNQYLGLHNIFKGVTLGVAAATFPRFAVDVGHRYDSLALWCASVLLALVNHTTTSRGVLLAPSRLRVTDVAFPLSLSLLECVLFFLVAPIHGGTGPSAFWYYVLACHGLVVVALISSVLRRSQPAVFAPPLVPLAAQYGQWVRNDRAGAVALSLTSVALGVVCTQWFADNATGAGAFHAAAGVLVSVGLVPAIAGAIRQRALIVRAVESLVRERTAGHGPQAGQQIRNA